MVSRRLPLTGPSNAVRHGFDSGARVGWYLAQYLAAARLAGPQLRHQALPEGVRFPGMAETLSDIADLFARERQHIRRGHYRPPQRHLPRPDRALSDMARFFFEVPIVQSRRRHMAHQEVDQTGAHDALPRYYRQNFHYQTDGYLSRRSARLYDHQVEVLFSGAAQAMRRQALPPLSEYFAATGNDAPRIADIGCGTGPMLQALAENWPRATLTGIDLSAAYLQEARRRLGRDPALLCAPAEAMPLPDESQDAVVSVFMFHELPDKIRKAVLREVYRVLKPGGRFVLVDSIQRGDRPAYDGLIAYFPVAYHEPYYEQYSRTDLFSLLETAALRPYAQERAFMSKVISAERPAA